VYGWEAAEGRRGRRRQGRIIIILRLLRGLAVACCGETGRPLPNFGR
jgi:hypothetical protein